MISPLVRHKYSEGCSMQRKPINSKAVKRGQPQSWRLLLVAAAKLCEMIKVKPLDPEDYAKGILWEEE